MKELLEFILKGILGKEKFDVAENQNDNQLVYTISTEDKNKGLIIGKGGKVISSLRNILKIRATLDKKSAWIEIA